MNEETLKLTISGKLKLNFSYTTQSCRLIDPHGLAIVKNWEKGMKSELTSSE